MKVLILHVERGKKIMPNYTKKFWLEERNKNMLLMFVKLIQIVVTWVTGTLREIFIVKLLLFIYNYRLKIDIIFIKKYTWNDLDIFICSSYKSSLSCRLASSPSS